MLLTIVMFLVAVSDWRIQDIPQLLAFVGTLPSKPDLIIYAGDDVARFNTFVRVRRHSNVISNRLIRLIKIRRIKPDINPQLRNYFQELARLSNDGLVAVAGNDDAPSISGKAISGEQVFDLHRTPLSIGEYAFIGSEGATSEIGVLLYSEDEVENHLETMYQKVAGKRIIVVSHCPPSNLLDFGIRFGPGHHGSKALKAFLYRHRNEVLAVICGHVHLQGGQVAEFKGIKIINCASHDNPNEPGKVALIHIDGNYVHVEWKLLYNLNDLTSVPLVGEPRARMLNQLGITSVRQLSEIDTADSRFLNYPHLSDKTSLIKTYAKAIVGCCPIVVREHEFFKNINPRRLYFFDAEYNPEPEGTFGIFLIGIMDFHGHLQQRFLDKPEDERQMLLAFGNWLEQNKPILVAYASSSADRPTLLKAFSRFGIQNAYLKNSFFDLFYECIFTQQEGQSVFLPIKDHGAKAVSAFLGYQEPPGISIRDGLDALFEYKEYLITGNPRSRSEILEYNKTDIERCKFIFERLASLFQASPC